MTRTFLVDSYGIFLPFLLFETEKQEWNGNGLGMNQEWTRNIHWKLVVSVFLVYSWSIPRNPQESSGLRWLSVKTSVNRVSPDIYPPFKGVTTRHFHSWTKWEGIEVSSPDAASSSRMSLVELCYKLRGVDIVPRLPGVMLDSKSFPFHQVAELPIHHLAVQNFLYNPFLFTID